jgi:hypothetical protein
MWRRIPPPSQSLKIEAARFSEPLEQTHNIRRCKHPEHHHFMNNMALAVVNLAEDSRQLLGNDTEWYTSPSGLLFLWNLLTISANINFFSSTMLRNVI